MGQADSDAEAIIYKPPVKIVYGGSGSVNGRDILVAKAANGKYIFTSFVCTVFMYMYVRIYLDLWTAYISLV